MNLKDEEIYTKIEEIYKNEKGKPFITHLTRSFLPINRSTFMLSNEKNKKMVCAITGVKLISKDEIFKFQLENVDDILKNFSDRLLGNTTENIVVDNFKGKTLAIECEKSDKLLCLQAVQQLLNFSATELLKGNKHIGFVLKNERNKAMGITKEPSEQKSYKKEDSETKFHTSTTSLGDFEVLANLKKKLEGK